MKKSSRRCSIAILMMICLCIVLSIPSIPVQAADNLSENEMIYGADMKLCEKPLIINVQYYSGEKMYKERFELPMKGINCLINTSNYVRMEQKKRDSLDEIGKQLEKIASET